MQLLHALPKIKSLMTVLFESTIVTIFVLPAASRGDGIYVSLFWWRHQC